MTIEEKLAEGKFLFENFTSNMLESAATILKEIKPGSDLDEEKIINILLEWCNRGASQHKLMENCFVCSDMSVLDGYCPACDELIQEVNSYKK